jgi:hypothetical protein
MIKETKFAILAAASAALVGASQAATYNGDLYVGFTTGVGNDLIYDLGAEATLTDGQSWDLSALLTGYNLSNVNWGVIGDKTIGGVRYSWTSTDPSSGLVPLAVPNTAAWGTLDTCSRAIFSNFGSAGAGQSLSISSTDDNSWNMQTIMGSLPTAYWNVYENPNVLGVVSNNFYGMIATNQPPQLIGHFSLASGGVLTFHVQASAPPPPPQLSINRSGTQNTISFATVSGPTYTLYYTNSPGLNTPVASWPASPNTVVGNGQTNSIQDTSTDPNRFYRVGAH